MPSVSNQHVRPLDRVLVIDDLPLIPLAFQEVFRSVNPSASVEYCGNIYVALSAKTYVDTTFDLVILGSPQERRSLEQGIRELKLYTAVYDPAIIDKMQTFGLDACVHRLESVEEIREAYLRLSAGTPYISGIFRTLFGNYGYDVRK